MMNPNNPYKPKKKSSNFKLITLTVFAFVMVIGFHAMLHHPGRPSVEDKSTFATGLRNGGEATAQKSVKSDSLVLKVEDGGSR